MEHPPSHQESWPSPARSGSWFHVEHPSAWSGIVPLPAVQEPLSPGSYERTRTWQQTRSPRAEGLVVALVRSLEIPWRSRSPPLFQRRRPRVSHRHPRRRRDRIPLQRLLRPSRARAFECSRSSWSGPTPISLGSDLTRQRFNSSRSRSRPPVSCSRSWFARAMLASRSSPASVDGVPSRSWARPRSPRRPGRG